MSSSSQNQQNSPEPALSRSGRVRKPKVFYDPSHSIDKRRSLPNMETTKSKKSTKATESEPMTNVEKTKRTPPVNAATINNRRRTICAASFIIPDDGTGCIVCGRADIKKGRFVSCIDCIKRGHFTCLRNDKLFKTADQENNWQCPACKICEHCRKFKPTEQLYKCIICLNSYHLHCSSKFAPLPKNVVKKKFTCGICTKGTTVSKPTIVESTTRSLIPNRKSDGFPGFAHEEATKIEVKTSTAVAKAKKAMSFPVNQTASQSSSNRTSNAESVEMKAESEIKKEKASPTPDHDINNTESYEPPSQVENTKKIAVRKDLVEPTFMETDVEMPESGAAFDYDTKTVITPHESVPDVKKWDCDEVCTYFMAIAPQYVQLLKDNQIDGDALLLIRREDVLNRFSLKLGPALRLYTHIVELQYKNNNPILAWNEFY
ncbi:supporter of activation of yellow protein [Contarinia nasturtii]|uniref:supporter of activation of yellow protein n=1 Tax=Contarinia nasturtii TaxID=265458 RepID=UPI0012D3D437|nr:supporter of activation of yellow protein [Contarinia nasturtii]